jgi:hypothetical protein
LGGGKGDGEGGLEREGEEIFARRETVRRE